MAQMRGQAVGAAQCCRLYSEIRRRVQLVVRCVPTFHHNVGILPSSPTSVLVHTSTEAYEAETTLDEGIMHSLGVVQQCCKA